MDTLEYTTSGKKTYLFLREQIYESHPVIAGIRMYDSSGEWIGGHAVLTKKRAIEQDIDSLIYEEIKTKNYDKRL